MVSYAKHPARLTALAAGEKTFTADPCTTHGEVSRWCSTGGCVDCGRERSREQTRAKAAARPKHRPVATDPARERARAAGKRTFRGRPCRNGHAKGERYVSTAGCVECARGRGK